MNRHIQRGDPFTFMNFEYSLDNKTWVRGIPTYFVVDFMMWARENS
jgi:hypothetical protein